MEWWLPLGLGALAVALLVLGRRESRALRSELRQARRVEAEARAERASLEQRSAWLEAAAEASMDPILVLDAERRVRFANDAARRLFGPLSQGPGIMAYTRSLELENLAAEGFDPSPEGQAQRFISIRDRAYKVTAVIEGARLSLALSDVSELQRLSRARQDLIGNLSHELRTPLTSLRLLAETFEGPGARDAQVARQLARKITAEVDALNQMTQEMLDLAAIEAGRQVVRLLTVPLDRLVAEPVERLAEQAERRKVTIRLDVDPAWVVLADPELARRAILNVLHNAVRFTLSGGEVSLWAAGEPDAQVILSIADQGPGIHPADRERIFERFYRGEAARGTPGTGLGLAIARHIMHAHMGSIWAENRRPPQAGAVFHLAFQAA